jgi:hypothetical protein
MTEQAISPLRRRMIEDMSIRKFAAKAYQSNPHSRGTANVPPSRFRPLEAFGRRPPSPVRRPRSPPASETLHTSGHSASLLNMTGVAPLRASSVRR